MSDIIIPEERIVKLRKKMKDNIGWTDDELDQLSTDQWSFINRMNKFRKYKMIAEVTQVNDHCELLPKIGDKYVFYGACMLNVEESTFPGVCMWAIAGIAPLSYMVMDRILSDLDPNEMWRNQVSCMDTSVRNGGLGNVLFKVYCEKI
ncbi:MAG: hypothetical protein SVR08_01460 [Spirochaetota bacterium]|nr:hypothetical protein [Spirochaetota bacterium]